MLREYTRVGSSALTFESYAHAGGTLLASRDNADSWKYLHVDHLGSVRRVTDSNGGLVSSHEYWPYGEEVTVSSSQQQMRYTGHERDFGAEAGVADDLDYMHARYYKPIWGRFLSVDPVGGKPGAPQSWNRYAYVRGNPVNAIDPDGRAWWLLGGAASGAAAEYAGQVVDNMMGGTTGPVHAFHENLNGRNIAVSAGFGAVTAGTSSVVQEARLGVRVLVAAALNLAEARTQAATNGKPLSNGTAITSLALGGFAKVGSELAHQGVQRSSAGSLRDLASNAQRLENIAGSGRPRAAQTLRADAARSAADGYGGGWVNEILTENAKKQTEFEAQRRAEQQ